MVKQKQQLRKREAPRVVPLLSWNIEECHFLPVLRDQIAHFASVRHLT